MADSGALQYLPGEGLEPARNEFIGIEHLTEMELEEIRKVLEDSYGEGSFRHGVVKRLIGRR